MNRTLTASLLLTALATSATTAVLTSGASAADGRAVLNAQLTGEQEVPGPGDEDGRGKGTLRVDAVTGEVCYTVEARKVADLSAGHVHEKAEGAQTGPVVLPLNQTGPTSFAGCTTDLEVARGLVEEPEDYYLNVHNAAFPAGALRGDLR